MWLLPNRLSDIEFLFYGIPDRADSMLSATANLSLKLNRIKAVCHWFIFIDPTEDSVSLLIKQIHYWTEALVVLSQYLQSVHNCLKYEESCSELHEFYTVLSSLWAVIVMLWINGMRNHVYMFSVGVAVKSHPAGDCCRGAIHFCWASIVQYWLAARWLQVHSLLASWIACR